MTSNDISKQFKGRNFMTPDVIRYGEINEHAVYELSSGTGIFSADLFGVTVKGTGDDFGLSKCFETREEAEVYIKELQQ